MNSIKILALAAIATIAIVAGTPKSEAQISFSIGVAPSCPYGYYDYTPYRCAPYGYYGPEWFNGRTFIGVGPWFHGSDDFRGHVNSRYDQQYGYNGRVPEYGERGHKRSNYPRRFKGDETRDGRGHGDRDNERNRNNEKH